MLSEHKSDLSAELITTNCITGFMPFLLFIKSPPGEQWATAIIMIISMHHQRVFVQCCRELLIATGGTDLGKVRTPGHFSVWYTEQAQMASYITTKLHNLALSLQYTELSGGILSILCFILVLYIRKKKQKYRSHEVTYPRQWEWAEGSWTSWTRFWHIWTEVWPQWAPGDSRASLLQLA